MVKSHNVALMLPLCKTTNTVYCNYINSVHTFDEANKVCLDLMNADWLTLMQLVKHNTNTFLLRLHSANDLKDFAAGNKFFFFF